MSTEAVAKKEKVALVGFSGSGKTTVGGILERKYGWRWLDLDKEIEQCDGRRVAEIIRVEGEEKFRELEHRALKRALSSDVRVISLGGGALLRSDNKKLLLEECVLVYLTVSKEEAVARVVAEEDKARESGAECVRPLLNQGGDARGQIADRVSALMEARKGLYDIAPIRVPTDSLGAEEVAGCVFREVREFINKAG